MQNAGFFKTIQLVALVPWRWVKNRRFRPAVQKRINSLLGLTPRPAKTNNYGAFNAHKGELLLAEGQENYVVCKRDKIIGRALFVRGEFELDKLFKALDIYAKPTAAMTFVDVGANN